jgi:hypothetical protein
MTTAWVTLISTLLGVALGFGSTLLVDRARSGRDDAKERQQIRRAAYVDFLTNISKAFEDLWALARRELLTEEPIDSAARKIIRTGGIYESRNLISIIAPAPVVSAANEAVKALHAFRNVVGSGASMDSPEYIKASEEFRASLRNTRQTLRDALENKFAMTPDHVSASLVEPPLGPGEPVL